MLYELLGRPRCAIVAGIGGGGDAASTVIIGETLRREGVRVVYASIVWERFVRDPQPGPVKLSELIGYESTTTATHLLPGCYAVRESSGVVVPSACKLSKLLGEPIGFLDAYRGELGVRESIEGLASLHGCDAVIGVDVGGDVLAEGWEDELWSPLADSIGLAAIAAATIPVKALAVHSPGSDGELPRSLVLERVSKIASRNGFLGALGVPRFAAELLEEAVEAVGTEAGRPAILAFKGYRGVLSIRGGSRRVEVDPCSTIMFLLDAGTAYSESPLAQAVYGTWSVWEARARLNSIGVYTELDLELDLLLDPEAAYDPSKLVELHEKGVRRLYWARPQQL